MKGHEVVGELNWHCLAICKDGRRLSFICALYDWKDAHGIHNVGYFVIFQQLARFIDSLVLAPEPLLAHEFKGENYVPLGIDAEHVHDDLASFHLILGHIEDIARPGFCLNCEDDACIIVNGHNVWQAGAASTQTARVPLATIQALDECVLITVSPASPDVVAQASTVKIFKSPL